MTDHRPSSTHSSSNAFETAALERFRDILMIVPEACLLHREVWDQSTILCIDFKRCPDQLEDVKDQALMLLMGANHLGLAQSISFRIGSRVKGWVNFASTGA